MRQFFLTLLILSLSACQRLGHPLGPTCGAPPEAAYRNLSKTMVLEQDRFFLFKSGISGYFNPPDDGHLVLKITDEIYGDVLPRCGTEQNFRLAVSPHIPHNERYFIRFPMAAMGDGGIDFVWELFFEPADGTQRKLVYRRTTKSNAKQELFGFDWFELLDERYTMNPHYYPEWLERGANYIRREDYQGALHDYQKARTILLEQKYVRGGTNEELDPRIVDARDYYQILRQLILLSLLQEDYGQARQFSQELLEHPTYGTTRHDEASMVDTVVSRDLLFDWYARVKSGDPNASGRLQVAFVKSQQENKRCYQDFAAFILDELPQEVFLSEKSQKAFPCQLSGQGGSGLRYFWSGLKADTKGDIKGRQEYLSHYYEESSRQFSQSREMLLTHQLLDKACPRTPRPYSSELPWRQEEFCSPQ